MAQKTLTADRSSILAKTAPSGGTNLGGGQDIHLAISKTSGGYQLRSLVAFTIPAGWWNDVRKLTKAEILLTGSAVNHVGRGATPQAYIYRATSAWTPNSAGESWTTAAIAYPGPSATSAGGVLAALPTATGQVAIDITAIVLAWAPASVNGPSAGQVGGNAANYGLSLQETGGSAQAAEVWSAKYGTASARPILRITYETNAPPAAPTLLEPLGPDQQANTFRFTTTDAEGDAISAYDIQCSTDSSFATVTHWNLVGGTSGITAGQITRAYGGTALVNNTRYYWRARCKDAGSAAYGPWSAGGTFVKGAGAGSTDQYDLWAAAILEDMAHGRVAIRLGTLRPSGEQVAALVAADYRDRFSLLIDDVAPEIAGVVSILGQRVSLTPDGWAIDAVVELEQEA